MPLNPDLTIKELIIPSMDMNEALWRSKACKIMRLKLTPIRRSWGGVTDVKVEKHNAHTTCEHPKTQLRY